MADKNSTTSKYVSFSKFSGDDRRIAYGVVYEPDKIDAHGDIMTSIEVEEAAHNFLTKDNLGNRIDTNHDGESNGSFPVESFIARKHDPDFPEGAWVMGVKVPDPEIWEMIKSGELNGFSFEARGKKIAKTIQNEYESAAIAKSQETNGHEHVLFVKLDRQGKVIKGMTSFDDGHSHTVSNNSVTDITNDHNHRFEI